MLSTLLIIIGGAIILWGVAVSVLIYRSRQDYLNSLTDQYLSGYSDSDTIPAEIALKIFRRLITRVIVIVSAVLFVEIAGFALLVVSQVI